MSKYYLALDPEPDQTLMKIEELPWSSCGTNLDICGCRFSLNVFSDDFVDVIMTALQNVDLTNVWSDRDVFSTIYRGRRIHVLDAVWGFFAQAYREDLHLSLEATFSQGCPGDIEADFVLEKSNELLNLKNLNLDFLVQAKLFLAPLSSKDYMSNIAYAVRLAQKLGIYVESAHYVTIIEGQCSEIFKYINALLAYANVESRHHVLQITLSVNSPSLNGNLK